jgi:hypothetical protein
MSPSRLPKPDGEGKRAYPVQPAPSLVETMWARLDEITTELMRAAVNEPSLPEEDWGQVKGEALGVAWCISVVESPYAPNVDAVRAEAMRRWKANQKG